MLVDDDLVNSFFSEIIIKETKSSIIVEVKNTVDKAFEYMTQSDYMTRRFTQTPFPDIIFLDIDMPGKNGWDFLERYQKFKHFLVKKPIIVMNSVSSSPADKLKAMSFEDVAEYYPKPLTPEIINFVLNKYCPANA